MTRILGVLAAASLLAGCAAASSRVRPPLEAEGELYVYLQPLGAEGERLALAVGSVEARRSSGPGLALNVAHAGALAAVAGQRLIAWGRLPPGGYTGLGVSIGAATLRRADGAADLLVPKEAVPVEAPIAIERGRATVVWLALDVARSLRAGVELSPAFAIVPPPAPVPEARAWVTSPDAGTVSVVDAQRLEVTAVLAPGGEPWGIAVSVQRLQVYVSRAAADDVLVLDLPSGAELARIRLRPGDRPGELALTPDGRLLLAVNMGSGTLSFIDPVAQLELDRVDVGQDPSALTLDRAGRTALVCNRLSSTVSLVDVPTRIVRATLATDADPVAVQLDRTESRLFVAHGLSPFLATYTFPGLRPLGRLMVGPGTTALRVDPRTDLLYLGRGEMGQVEVLEPGSLVKVGALDAVAGAGYAAIDDARNALWVLGRGGEGLTVVDLASRKALGVVELAGPPQRVALVGERR